MQPIPLFCLFSFFVLVLFPDKVKLNSLFFHKLKSLLFPPISDAISFFLTLSSPTEFPF